MVRSVWEREKERKQWRVGSVSSWTRTVRSSRNTSGRSVPFPPLLSLPVSLFFSPQGKKAKTSPLSEQPSDDNWERGEKKEISRTKVAEQISRSSCSRVDASVATGTPPNVERGMHASCERRVSRDVDARRNVASTPARGAHAMYTLPKLARFHLTRRQVENPNNTPKNRG